jgi:hypothetical protein
MTLLKWLERARRLYVRLGWNVRETRASGTGSDSMRMTDRASPSGTSSSYFVYFTGLAESLVLQSCAWMSAVL